MIFQFTLLIASLFAATSRVSQWLKAYLWMAAGLELIAITSLLNGYGISTKVYGFMWALYNAAMLLFATAYAKPSARVMLFAVAIFSLLGRPEKWYLWLSGAKGIWCLALGLTLIIDGGSGPI